MNISPKFSPDHLFGDWISNEGNSMPWPAADRLLPIDRVQVKCKNGICNEGQARLFDWLWTEADDSIEFYRFLKTHPHYGAASAEAQETAAQPEHDTLADNPLYGMFG